MLHARSLLPAACVAAALLLSACGYVDGEADQSALAAGAATARRAPVPAPAPRPAAKPKPLDLSGSVSYLSDVGFIGGPGGDLSFRAPRDGAPCSPERGFADIVPGAAVTVSSDTAKILATVPLGEARAATSTRGTTAERDARAELIDATFNLRIAKTWNTLKQARLYEAQAKQHLFDARHPGEWGFEGAKFVAVWCRLEFVASDLPPQDSYVVQVADRSPTVVSRADLESDPAALDLYLD